MKRRFAPRRATFFGGSDQVPRPVIGIDIDGTLGFYHEHFLTFAEGWFGFSMPAGYDGSVSMAEWMGVSKARYRQCKLAFRKGGLKRSMPAKEGGMEMAQAFRTAGALVIICTTRPFLMLDNIDPDTQEWLRRNHIQRDGVLHGEHKYRLLRQQFGERVIMVLEDLPELCSQAYSAYAHPVQIMGRANSASSNESSWPQVHSLAAATKIGTLRINEYKIRNGM